MLEEVSLTANLPNWNKGPSIN